MLLRYLFCLFIATLCDGARILGVFQTPSISHQVVFRKVMVELARRGHEVVSITTDPMHGKEKPDSLTEIDVHDVSYKYWAEEFVPKMSGAEYDPVTFMEIYYACTHDLIDIQFGHPDVKALINHNQTFDLVIFEGLTRTSAGFSHIFKTPLISLNSLAVLPTHPSYVGFSGHPLIFPNILTVRHIDMSVWDKVMEIYYYVRLYWLSISSEWFENKKLKEYFGEDCPTVSELMENVDLTLLNENAVFGETRPVPPSLVYMGSVHMDPVKELPKDLKEHMDRSKNGIIYMSLGTNVNPSLLPQATKDIFTKVLSSLPYDVMIKWDTDELVGKYKNIYTRNWFPQNDLLRHPKLKLFISQGGLQSTDEAISAHVPMIALPVLADQFYNGEQYMKHGIGMRIRFDEITENNFREAIELVIGNKSYKDNIARLDARIRDQPQSPLERGIWWIEYVLRHNGAKHLHSALAHATWFEYLALDALAIILVIFITALGLLFVGMNIMIELYNFGLKGNLEMMSSKKCD